MARLLFIRMNVIFFFFLVAVMLPYLVYFDPFYTVIPSFEPTLSYSLATLFGNNLLHFTNKYLLITFYEI